MTLERLETFYGTACQATFLVTIFLKFLRILCAAVGLRSGGFATAFLPLKALVLMDTGR